MFFLLNKILYYMTLQSEPLCQIWVKIILATYVCTVEKTNKMIILIKNNKMINCVWMIFN